MFDSFLLTASVPMTALVLVRALKHQVYSKARSRVRTLAGTSDEIGVGVHQRSALSPLLFVPVMQEATRAARGEGLWVLLYVDNLVITAESEEKVIRKFGVWKREMETRGLKVGIIKTKLMVTGREPAVRPQRGNYPFGVLRQRSSSKVSVVKGGATSYVRGSEI